MVVRTRLSREESRRETVRRLLESASELIAARGFDRVTVDDIAETAGFSKGAFYSNFASKEDILVALLAQGQQLWASTEDEAFEDFTSLEEFLGFIDEAATRMAPDISVIQTGRDFVLTIELWLQAMRRPELRPLVKDLFDNWIDVRQRQVGHFLEAAGGRTPGGAEILGAVVAALQHGFFLQMLADRDEAAVHRYGEGLKLLLRSVVALSQQPEVPAPNNRRRAGKTS